MDRFRHGGSGSPAGLRASARAEVRAGNAVPPGGRGAPFGRPIRAARLREPCGWRNGTLFPRTRRRHFPRVDGRCRIAFRGGVRRARYLGGARAAVRGARRASGKPGLRRQLLEQVVVAVRGSRVHERLGLFRQGVRAQGGEQLIRRVLGSGGVLEEKEGASDDRILTHGARESLFLRELAAQALDPPARPGVTLDLRQPTGELALRGQAVRQEDPAEESEAEQREEGSLGGAAKRRASVPAGAGAGEREKTHGVPRRARALAAWLRDESSRRIATPLVGGQDGTRGRALQARARRAWSPARRLYFFGFAFGFFAAGAAVADAAPFATLEDFGALAALAVTRLRPKAVLAAGP